MVELRPYQRDLLQQVQTALAADTKARVMMQLPTGGGKTIIVGALLADWLTGGRKAVWLTHRRELAEQTCRMLTDAHISAMTDSHGKFSSSLTRMRRTLFSQRHYPFLGQLGGIAHRRLDGFAGDRRIACRDFFWIQIRREVVEDCGH